MVLRSTTRPSLRSLTWSVRARTLGLGLTVGCAACLFPEYTFESGSAGEGGTTTQSSSVASTGGAGGIGGAGTSSSAQGGAGGAGGAAPAEDCLAPGDEDGNGTADCADPACDVDVECVDSIPVGWGSLGLVALFDGATAEAPTCADGATPKYVGNAVLNQAPAECTPCTCGAPTWSSCAFTGPDLDAAQPGLQPLRLQDATCGGTSMNPAELTVPVPWDLACVSTDLETGGGTCPGANCNQSIFVGTARPSGGSCAPGGGVPTNATPTWSRTLTACPTPTALEGCSGGKVCRPRPPAPFEGRVCVAKPGDQTCPAVFTEKHLAQGSYDDERSCTACSCNAATGGTCTLSVSLFGPTDTNCSMPLATFDADATTDCVDLVTPPTPTPSVGKLAATVKTPPSGGMCASPIPAIPSGAFVPAEPTTFCCLLAD
jgi:hypothetical protein